MWQQAQKEECQELLTDVFQQLCVWWFRLKSDQVGTREQLESIALKLQQWFTTTYNMFISNRIPFDKAAAMFFSVCVKLW